MSASTCMVGLQCTGCVESNTVGLISVHGGRVVAGSAP